MKTFQEKLETLQIDCIRKLKSTASKQITKSQFQKYTSVIRVVDTDNQINLANGYLVEVSETALINNDGNEYDFYSIPIDELTFLADNLT
jgi:adenylate kinase